MTLHLAVLRGDPRLPYDYAPGGVFGAEEREANAAVERALATMDDVCFTVLDDHAALVDALRARPPDLVLNLCDVGFGNHWDQELHVPALLDVLGVPYTGSGPTAIALSNEKTFVAAAARALGVPVPEQLLVDARAERLPLPSRYPVLVKPNVGAGSFGITASSVVHDAREAEARVRALAADLDPPEVLLQEYLPGAEYTVGLLGNPGALRVLPPLEVDFDGLDPGLPPILTHAAKADPGSPYWSQIAFRRARPGPGVVEALGHHAARVFERLGFRDYARVDFRCGADGVPRLLDANVNPTWHAGGKLARMASWAGLDYAALLRAILDAALARHRDAGPPGPPPAPR